MNLYDFISLSNRRVIIYLIYVSFNSSMIMGNKQRGSDGRFVSVVDSVDLEGSLSADSPMAKVLAGASAVSDAVAEGAEVSADTLTDAGHDEVSGEVPAEGADAEASTEMPTEAHTDALDGMPLGVLESDAVEGSVEDDVVPVEGNAVPTEEERPRVRHRDVRRSDVRSLIASRRSESERRMGTETQGFGARAVVASRKAGSSLGSARSVIRDRLSGNLRGGVGGSKCTTKVIG